MILESIKRELQQSARTEQKRLGVGIGDIASKASPKCSGWHKELAMLSVIWLVKRCTLTIQARQAEGRIDRRTKSVLHGLEENLPAKHNQQGDRHPQSSDERYNPLGWYYRKRIRYNARNHYHAGVRLQVTYSIYFEIPIRLGIWVIQMLRAAPVEKPATAGALINSTFYGNV
jgi:hypothetical protein